MIAWIRKWKYRLGLGAFVLVLAGLVGCYFAIDLLVGRVIEQEGTRATGVEASVEDVSVGLFGGPSTMSGLRLNNPNAPVFHTDSFLDVKDINTRVRMGSLFESTIDIPSMHMDGLHLIIERVSGGENYKIILEQIKGRVQERADAGEEDWQFRIHELKLTNIEVTFSGFPGMNRKIQLADIHMSDVGSKEKPMTITTMYALMFRAIFVQLLTNPQLLPGTVVAGLNEGLRGLVDLGGITVRFVGDITDGAGNVISEVGGTAGAVGEAVGGAIGGLFGGGDESKEETNDTEENED